MKSYLLLLLLHSFTSKTHYIPIPRWELSSWWHTLNFSYYTMFARVNLKIAVHPQKVVRFFRNRRFVFGIFISSACTKWLIYRIYPDLCAGTLIDFTSSSTLQLREAQILDCRSIRAALVPYRVEPDFCGGRGGGRKITSRRVPRDTSERRTPRHRPVRRDKM